MTEHTPSPTHAFRECATDERATDDADLADWDMGQRGVEDTARSVFVTGRLASLLTTHHGANHDCMILVSVVFSV